MKIITALLLLISVAAFSQASTSGLIGHWSFNGNANDESTNASNGVVSGAVLTLDKQNNPDRAYYFDGTSNRIDLGNNPVLNVSDQVTVALWIRLKSVPSGQDRVISKGGDKYVLFFQNNTIPVAYMMSSPVKNLNFGSPLEINRWYHLAFTYNSNASGNNLKSYIDGTLSNQQASYGVLGEDNLNLIIGNYVSSTSYGFHGDVDEVRIYNRALSDSEIVQVYNDNSSFENPTPLCYQLFCNEDGVGIGTPEVPQGYKLAVQGKVIAEGVKVEMQTKWPDYVFEDGYRMRSLKEVGSFIGEHKHLPEIPSADEVKANGIDLGQMNAKLLQKIEELTLYQIQLLEMLEKQEARIRSLEKKNAELR